MMLTKFEMKYSFFDRQVIKSTVGRDRAKFLNNIGGFVRKTAIRSMRPVGKKGKPSAPGKPPKFRAEGEQHSLRRILYAFNGAGGIIVGPVALNQKAMFQGMIMSGVAPRVHELGGTMGHQEKFKPYSVDAALAAFGEARGRKYVDEFGVQPRGFYRRYFGKEYVEHRDDPAMGGIWVPVGRRRRDRFLVRFRQAKYPKRPYMRPAVEKAQKRFNFLWFGSGLAEAA